MNRKEILIELNNFADKEWAQDKNHINIISSQKPIIGVRTPQMRILARKYAKTDFKGTISVLKSEYLEEDLLFGFMLGYVQDANECYSMLIDFLPRIDNWAVCDQTCASTKVFSKDKNNKYFEKFLALAQNSQEFYARVGIIMLMTYYLKQECIDKIFKVLANISNHQYYVDMAVAWLVSVAFVKFEQSTTDLLKSKKLQKRVQNKAICKIRDSFRVENYKKDLVKQYRI